MKCDSKSLLTSALSVIFMYHSIVNGSVEALWTKLAAPFFDNVGTIKSSDLLKEIKMNHVLLRLHTAGYPERGGGLPYKMVGGVWPKLTHTRYQVPVLGAWFKIFFTPPDNNN